MTFEVDTKQEGSDDSQNAKALKGRAQRKSIMNYIMVLDTLSS